ncbi:MAG: JAB domain-containing protein, partial [Verrucomicrobia bacterium]|nr:JAB domain-containing protein [Verrucomicrobiota bacterium]
EWKLVSLRECPTPAQIQECTTPEQAAEYWKLHVQTNPYFNPDVEFFVVVLLNTRMRIKGHVIVGMGILDSVLVHPREVFRVAIVASAYAVLVMHNHPGGDPSPSEADIRTTRDLIRAGQLLRIEVLDHVIMGQPAPERIRSYSSLKELGQFFR